MVMVQGEETLEQGCNEVVVQKVTWGLKQGCSKVAKKFWGNSRKVLMRLQGGCRYIVVRLWQSCGEDVVRLKGCCKVSVRLLF